MQAMQSTIFVRTFVIFGIVPERLNSIVEILLSSW